MTTTSILHVRATPKGDWIVDADQPPEETPGHATAEAAMRAAREFAAMQQGETYVVLHDRYMRTTTSGPIGRTHASAGTQ